MGALTDSSRVIAGRYRLVEHLGSGGMGHVWLAHDELLRRQVAVKEVFPPAGLNDDEREMLRERTLREARTAARLNHPNVVTIYDVVEDDGRPWIVMELIQARSLRDLVDHSGPLDPRAAARIGLQVLGALQSAHAIGVMHRDVKPGNVLLDAEGRAVLADFGIARAEGGSATTSGALVGSPSYIAPERARGERGGPESDLWSLGATLYAAVEGRPPYDRAGALPTLMAVVSEAPDPPRQAGVLWPVISGLLAADPATRLSAADAGQMLRQVAESGAGPATIPMPGPDQLTGAGPGGAGWGGAGRGGAGWGGAGRGGAGWGGAGRGGAGRGGADRGEAMGTLERAERTRTLHLPAGVVPDPPSETPGAARPPGPLGSPEPPRPDGGSLTPSDPERPARVKPAPAPRTTAGRRSRRTAVLALAATIVAVAATALGLSLTSRPAAGPSAAGQPGHSATPAPSRPAGRSSRRAGTQPPTAPRSAPAASPTAKTPPHRGYGARAVVPAGYHTYRDPTGFSIALPSGWRVSYQGHYTYLKPPSGASFLLIDQSDHPKPNPLADWQQQEASRRSTYPGYRRIRLVPIHYPQAEKAADWEFSYDRNGVPTHVLNRNVLANADHAYALYWSTPESEWASEHRIFEVLARTFQPAHGPQAGRR